MDNWLKPYIEKLQNIFEINEYDQFVTDLYEILRSKEYPNDIIVQIRKRATIKHENLKKIMIQNEYDLQHLLYAALKPLYKNFNDYFNKQFDRKTVKLFVLQPVKL